MTFLEVAVRYLWTTTSMSPQRIATTVRREVALLREDKRLFSRAFAERVIAPPP